LQATGSSRGSKKGHGNKRKFGHLALENQGAAGPSSALKKLAGGISSNQEASMGKSLKLNKLLKGTTADMSAAEV
jgi:hypothetical protein